MYRILTILVTSTVAFRKLLQTSVHEQSLSCRAGTGYESCFVAGGMHRTSLSAGPEGRRWLIHRKCLSVYFSHFCNQLVTDLGELLDLLILLLQGLFQRLILHLLLPQAGVQRHALRTCLCTHLSDLLIGFV